MSFYTNQKEEFIQSSTKGLKLYLKSNLADFPKANLIMIHGITENLGIFTHAASFFAKNGLNVFRYDLRGHGKSQGIRMYIEKYTSLSDDLDKIVDFVKQSYFNLPTFVIGHSLGGQAVLLYGRLYPKKVDGLLASDPLSFYTVPTLGKLPMKGDPKKYFPFYYDEGSISNKRALAKYKTDPYNQHKLTVGIMNMSYDGALYLRKNIGKFLILSF